MITGVNFQPGQNDQTPGAKKRPGDPGVQEAIKVLSLRLPRVVGAQAISPLLNAAGSGGNPRVDSVVNQVMSRMFPQGQPPPGGAPMIGPQPGESGTMPVSPRFDGGQPSPMLRDLVQPEPSWRPPHGFAPRIAARVGGGITDLPGGDDPGGGVSPPPPFDDGSGQPPAAIAPGPDSLGAVLEYLIRRPPPSDISPRLI